MYVPAPMKYAPRKPYDSNRLNFLISAWCSVPGTTSLSPFHSTPGTTNFSEQPFPGTTAWPVLESVIEGTESVRTKRLAVVLAGV